MLSDTWIAEDKIPRRVTQIAIDGGDAIASKFYLYYGEQLIGIFQQTGAGAHHAVTNDDMQSVSSKKVLRPGETLSLVVKNDAWDCNTSTYSGCLVVNVKDIVRRRGRRRYRRR